MFLRGEKNGECFKFSNHQKSISVLKIPYQQLSTSCSFTNSFFSLHIYLAKSRTIYYGLICTLKPFTLTPLSIITFNHLYKRKIISHSLNRKCFFRVFWDLSLSHTYIHVLFITAFHFSYLFITIILHKQNAKRVTCL